MPTLGAAEVQRYASALIETMYCPKCGDVLDESDAGVQCLKGQMALSQHLARRFKECFIFKSDEPRNLRFDFKVGGEWFCPGCSVKMAEEDGYVRCPQCELSLNEFIRHLVELHPHLNEKERKEWWD